MASDKKLSGVAVVVVVFVLGAATGGAASYGMMQRHYARMFRERPDMMDGRRLGALSRRLDLDSDQREKIRGIMERHGEDRRKLTREMYERCGDQLKAAQNQLDEEVRKALRPEQVPRYDAVAKERRERFGFGPR